MVDGSGWAHWCSAVDFDPLEQRTSWFVSLLWSGVELIYKKKKRSGDRKCNFLLSASIFYLQLDHTPFEKGKTTYHLEPFSSLPKHRRRNSPYCLRFSCLLLLWVNSQVSPPDYLSISSPKCWSLSVLHMQWLKMLSIQISSLLKTLIIPSFWGPVTILLFLFHLPKEYPDA